MTDYGDPRVDDAVRRLDELAERPVRDHVEVFEDIHERFRDALADPSSGDPVEAATADAEAAGAGMVVADAAEAEVAEGSGPGEPAGWRPEGTPPSGARSAD
ncbi:MAG: hypothetical protein GEU93_03985 [Propionibacteriales bacterium]|nr:hypothetical protein [Propionibacteriales bacterium]